MIRTFLVIFFFFSISYTFSQNSELYFRSGFESGTQIIQDTVIQDPVRTAQITGIDNTYLPPNDWDEVWGDNPPIRNFDFYYEKYIREERIAHIIQEPNKPLNKVVQFIFYDQPNDSEFRITSTLRNVTSPYDEFSNSIRLYIPNEMSPLKDPEFEFGFLTLMEWWNNPPWREDYGFRIRLNLTKELNTSNMNFQIAAQNSKEEGPGYDPNIWVEKNEKFRVPLGEWITFKVYFREGDEKNGRFKITATSEDNTTTTLFDITNYTYNFRDPDPDGISYINPMKLYTRKSIIDYVQEGGGTFNVLWDDFVVCNNENLDLQIRNSKDDLGVEPDSESQNLYTSNDIWIRNNDDGIQTHESPEHDPNNPNYVYVRVNNKSCIPSSGSDILKLYWGKGGTSLKWPDYWNGDVSNNNIDFGGEIGTLTIPRIEAGQKKILKFIWNAPNPDDYSSISYNPSSFALLARIESSNDPMASPEVSSVQQNVQNNNNISRKNITILNQIIETKPEIIADAGNDRSINKHSTITLTAKELAEIENYNWYDTSGVHIYSGKDITVSPEISQKYKLEVIDKDGFKDYDEVFVKVNTNRIQSIFPNPSSNNISVQYDTHDIKSAYLMIVDIKSGISNNFILNVEKTKQIIDISNYDIGLYVVFLICDSQIVDNKTILKE